MGKITKYELDDTFLAELVNQNGVAFNRERNTVTVSSAVSSVSHGLTSYYPDRDILLVYSNTTHLQEGDDYTVSADGLAINSASGNWDAGTTFDFVLFSIVNSPEPGVPIDGKYILEDSINLISSKRYNIKKSGKDTNGVFTVIDFVRKDGTLYMKSTLSVSATPDPYGTYDVQTEDYYKADGTTIDKTITYHLTYDADGDIVSRTEV